MFKRQRRPIGVEIAREGTSFRVWAPAHRDVSVIIDGIEHALHAEDDGYFGGVIDGAGAGARYRFRIDGSDETYPDPASRFQPDGPHGDSEVVDPSVYRWSDGDWRGVDKRSLVIYEMHIGTFTREGTWRAAIEQLAALRDTGINLIEIMPVHEFPGRFGWGYDGVDLWAPTRLYGRPDDFRAFVDAAHFHGLGVILDVVYNHFGPDGCYLSQFSPDYFTKKYMNEWGEAINFDGPNAEGVREFFAENAAYWIEEFHLDGLRLDATQSIHDASQENVVTLIVRRAREAAKEKEIFIVGENEPQEVKLIDDYGLDALWNDDWHHAAMVAATGKREAYYTDYRGAPQEFVSMAQSGFLYQGQYYSWQKDRRGTPSAHLPPESLVCFLQNHDQVANSARGERLQFITDPGRYRALTALLLLGPNTPMLFQGQEFGSSAPFLFFADHEPELAAKVAKGRRESLEQFPSLKALHGDLPAPDDVATFERCKLGHRERETHAEVVALHRDLLRLRMEMIGRVRGAVIGAEVFALRYGQRLLIVNLGAEIRMDVVPEPLLAPPLDRRWELRWSSDSPDYGGPGIIPIETKGTWIVAAHAAIVMNPRDL
ncbi:MAG TPA: malto-oligosyltrehalose trehalohydrolase [Thermoanaerobaculia bacterium]|jgi:maltooligosyltrehalose trehalohydrolase|nr:malto-oligosyltrehalose trehalohydrolase [Thermoanaerobaculia bacterium]